MPRTMGRPDTLPGIRSISSHSVQSISVSVLAVLFTLLILSTLKLPQQHRSLLWKAHDKSKVLLADEMIEMLSREISPLIEIPDNDPRAPATDYSTGDVFDGRRGTTIPARLRRTIDSRTASGPSASWRPSAGRSA